MQDTPPFEVCFNHLSLQVDNSDDGFEKLHAAISGMLRLYSEQFCDAEANLYFEGESIGEHIICDGFTVSDFFNKLYDIAPDAHEAFLSFVTMTPFSEGLTYTVQLNCIRDNYTIEGWHGEYIKIHYFALSNNCYLLSLPCAGWNKNKIHCYKGAIETEQTINNIFSSECANFFINEIRSLQIEEETKRVYRCDSGTFYIYFKDHNPPHVHFRSANDNCCLVINDSSLLCGILSPANSRFVGEFLADNREEMINTWNRICN